MARRWSPYSDIPSVYDMFVQAAGPRGEVERFGRQIFRNTPPENDRTIPIDFPASPDYVVGPGDGLAIDLWGGVSQRLVRIVDREGRISLPEVGPIAGERAEPGASSSSRCSACCGRSSAMCRPTYRSRGCARIRVYVVGDVNRPGPYDVSSLSTPLNALLAAGGPSADGSLRSVDHYRGSVLVQRVDLYDLLLRGVRTDMQRLEPGDTLLVPPVGAQIRIDGMVRRPAIYELHGETTLAQALDLAGGILPTAALEPYRSAAAGRARKAHHAQPGHLRDAPTRARSRRNWRSFEIQRPRRDPYFPDRHVQSGRGVSAGPRGARRSLRL